MFNESKAGPLDSGPKQDQNLEGVSILTWTAKQVQGWLINEEYSECTTYLANMKGKNLAAAKLKSLEQKLGDQANRASDLWEAVEILLRKQQKKKLFEDGDDYESIMETRGTPVQSAAAAAASPNDGGSGASDLSTKVDELKKIVENLALAVTKDENTPSLTRALAGAKEWQNALHKIEFVNISDGISAEFLMEEDCIRCTSEEEVMEVIFSKFGLLISDLNTGLKVVDSETVQWLPQGSNHLNRYDLKPDGFVILEEFTDVKDKGQGYLKGKPALKTELFDCIRSIIEGKATNAHSNEALGQASIYAEKLQKYIPVLHVLLIDKARFRACRFRKSNLVSAITGSLNEKGSAVFIKKFLLGAAESLDTILYDRQSCALSPRVTELENVTRKSERYWKEHHSLEFLSVLGKGMTGIVLQLRCRASSAGASLNKGVYAAKISHPFFASQVQQEINNYNLLKNVQDTKKCFATMLHSQSTEDFTTILTEPVGQPWDRQDNANVEFALQALLNFHALGFVHGDARVANIRKKCSSNDYFLIDFAELKSTTDSASRQADLGVFFCSVLRKYPERGQGWTLALNENVVKEINTTYPLGEIVSLDDSDIKRRASVLAKIKCDL